MLVLNSVETRHLGIEANTPSRCVFGEPGRCMLPIQNEEICIAGASASPVLNRNLESAFRWRYTCIS